MSMDRYFWNLTVPQKNGLACVLCGAHFLDPDTRVSSLAVGRSPDDDAQVYACLSPCAELIADDAERLALEIRAAASDDKTDEMNLDRRVFSVDGYFGALLRDLRTLAGAEALLSSTEDTPTLRFLLALTARHAEAAMLRARLVMARTVKEEGN